MAEAAGCNESQAARCWTGRTPICERQICKKCLPDPSGLGFATAEAKKARGGWVASRIIAEPAK